MSILRKVARMAAERGAPFDEAEEALTHARRVAGAGVADRKLETPVLLEAATVQHRMAREARLYRWLGWDLAPPVELDFDDED